jgi:NADH-quinone oxidoreductase subunit J
LIGDLGTDTNTGELFIFWLSGTLAVIGALGMVISKKAVHSALWIALTMINLAILYIANSAPFLGMVQIIVYTGAVMMLFLFVLMVVGVDASDSLIETIKGQRVAALAFGIGFAILLTVGLVQSLQVATTIGLDEANAVAGGNVQGLAALIFTDYVVAFQVVAAVLITAAMGAMILAHRERWESRKSQRQLSLERFSGPDHPGNMPTPGVYARHNAVDTPALLPDGSTSALSVPEPLRLREDVRPMDEAEITEVAEIAEAAGENPQSGVEGDST